MHNIEGFIVKDECSFDLYPHLLEGSILQSFLEEAMYHNLPIKVVEVLKVAWNSRFWDEGGYDGATFIKNTKHPALANFIHDYHYRTGNANKKADIIYRELLLLTGYSKSTAKFRYRSIRIFGSYFRLKHRLKGNVKFMSYKSLELYELIR
jgi:hypothetical protein